MCNGLITAGHGRFTGVDWNEVSVTSFILHSVGPKVEYFYLFVHEMSPPFLESCGWTSRPP